MLVSGLKDEALSTMISNSHGNFSGVHQALCDCAQEMVDKYKQKQETPENRRKLEVKTRAATVLFQELGKVPKDADADTTHEALLSALECHVAALQGYEHLTSEKSSNYALIKQTKGLRKHGDTLASLLWYHELKNKFLGSDSPLNAEQQAIVSVLAEKKGLTLKMLETMKAFPDRTFMVMKGLHEAGLLESDWGKRVFDYKNPFLAATVLKKLNKAGLLKLDLPNLWDEVFKHENPLLATLFLETLNEEDLLNWWFDVLRHKDSGGACKALVKLKKHKLNSLDNFYAVINHRDPFNAASAIIYLDSVHKLTEENRNLVLAQESPLINARILFKRSDLAERDPQ